MLKTIAGLAQGQNQKQKAENANRLVQDALNVVTCEHGVTKLGYAACLETRFIPNERLIRVFGLNNAFTTKDSKRARAFSTEAVSKIIAVTNQNWEDYVEFSLESVAVDIKKMGTKLNLAKLVQSVTLKTSLKFLFDLDKSVFDKPDAANNISFVAKEINRLWQASKNAGETTEIKWEDQGNLHQALHALLDSSGKTRSDDPGLADSEQNPMNWILPAYETMWRVVLRGLVEVRFHDSVKEEHQGGWLPVFSSLLAVLRGLIARFFGAGEEEQESAAEDEQEGAAEEKQKAWLQALDSFIEDPNQDIVPKKGEPVQFSARHVALECLRLYPPTRRIDRQFSDEDTIAKADIEACQRLELLASDQPQTFDPNRWVHIDNEIFQKVSSPAEVNKLLLDKGFMPFGAGKFQCPANLSGFGWKMIALLIGSLSRSLDGDWKVVEGELPPVGEALRSGR